VVQQNYSSKIRKIVVFLFVKFQVIRRLRVGGMDRE